MRLRFTFGREYADVDCLEKIANRIRAEREALGLKQAQMADRVGVGQSYIGKIERGERIPPADVLVTLITDGLGMSLGTFFAPWSEPEADVERYAKRVLVSALRDSRQKAALKLIESLKLLGP